MYPPDLTLHNPQPESITPTSLVLLNDADLELIHAVVVDILKYKVVIYIFISTMSLNKFKEKYWYITQHGKTPLWIYIGYRNTCVRGNFVARA